MRHAHVLLDRLRLDEWHDIEAYITVSHSIITLYLFLTAWSCTDGESVSTYVQESFVSNSIIIWVLAKTVRWSVAPLPFLLFDCGVCLTVW